MRVTVLCHGTPVLTEAVGDDVIHFLGSYANKVVRC